MSRDVGIPQRDDVLAKLRAFLHKRGEVYGLEALGVFGSVARGEAGEASDVDVVMQIERPNLFVTANIKEELEEILQCPVDLVRLHPRMNPSLKHRIEQEAIYV